MRRLLPILLALGLCLSAAAQPDTTGRYAPLDSLLSQFYGALEREEVSVKNSEFDTLIGSCTDSLMRQHVALSVFDHYRYSRVMGEEAVAVHLYDEWIATGKVQPRSEFELFEAERFFFCGMREGEAVSVESLPFYKFGGFSAVETVSGDRVTYMRQMHSYLMCAAGLYADFHKCMISVFLGTEAFEDTYLGMCALSAFVHDGTLYRLGRRASDRKLNGKTVFADDPFDKSLVLFYNSTCTHLRRKLVL